MRTLLLLVCLASAAAETKPPNYEDDVKPILRRRCFACHSAAEMRAGLNLESYGGVMKGGGSGDAVKAGRPSGSILYQAVAHEGDGIPRMPLGGSKIPDAEIAVIQNWIQSGLLENASSKPKGTPVSTSAEFKPGTYNKPAGPPAFPRSLAPVSLPATERPHPVTAMAASPWAPLLAVAGHEQIFLYNLDQRTLIGSLAFPEGVPYILHFSRDGALLLAGGGKGAQSGKVVLFDVKTGGRLRAFGQETDIVLAADVTSDGKRIALGGPGKIVKVFNVADGKLLYEIKKHTDWITALEFSPDGTKLSTGDRAGGIHLWETSAGGILLSLSEHKDSITSLSWRGDGGLLASGSEDGALIIWDARDGFPSAAVPNAHAPKPPPNTFGKLPNGVLSVQFLADGRIASVGRDRIIKLWTSAGKPQSASMPLDSMLTKVAVGPDPKAILAGDAQGRILLWDGKQVAPLVAKP